MKQAFLFWMLLTGFFLNAQVNLKVIGSVTNTRDKTPIPNCPVILKGSDGTLVQAKTDASGNYSMKLKFGRVYDIYTNTDKTVTTPTARLGFLASDDHGHFDTGKDYIVLQYQKDFALTPVIECELRMPQIIFKKNSIILDTIDQVTSELDSTDVFPLYALKFYANVLKKNPTIIVELAAHCSGDEKYPDKLSQQRARYIKQELIKLNIAADRVVAKGWGARKRKIQDAVILKAKTKEEKEMLHAINRRCTFKIISWDYVEPNSSKVEIPTYTPPVKEGQN